MTLWTEGYVAEIDYAHSFYPEMAPGLLAFALLCRGVRPPVAAGRPFVYGELGCGQGLTSNALAALHPDSRFVAVDLSPSHMEGAQKLSAEAGTQNAEFRAETFADFLSRPGEEFDVIALHGVWSWVSDDNRRMLTEILRQRLKPGGALYVSYNCLPGWAADMPVRQLLLEQVEAGTGPLPQRIASALDFCRALARRGGYFDLVPSAAAHLDSLVGKTDSYIAHEYLNRHWAPFYHSQVVEQLAGAGLSYAGSAAALDYAEAWSLDAGAARMLAAMDDGVRRETLRDTLICNRFRRDIFVREPEALSPEERREELKSLWFGLCASPADVPTRLNAPSGEDVAPQGLAAELVEALTQGPRPLADILPAHADFEDVARILAVLVGLGKVAPSLPPHAEAETRCAGFNAAILRRNRHGAGFRQVAAPVLGSAIMLDVLDRLFLLALAEDAEPPAFVWAVLSERGQTLRRDGSPLEGAQENLTELRRLFNIFAQERLPWLRSLGIHAERVAKS